MKHLTRTSDNNVLLSNHLLSLPQFPLALVPSDRSSKPWHRTRFLVTSNLVVQLQFLTRYIYFAPLFQLQTKIGETWCRNNRYDDFKLRTCRRRMDLHGLCIEPSPSSSSFSQKRRLAVVLAPFSFHTKNNVGISPFPFAVIFPFLGTDPLSFPEGSWCEPRYTTPMCSAGCQASKVENGGLLPSAHVHRHHNR